MCLSPDVCVYDYCHTTRHAPSQWSNNGTAKCSENRGLTQPQRRARLPVSSPCTLLSGSLFPRLAMSPWPFPLSPPMPILCNPPPAHAKNPSSPAPRDCPRRIWQYVMAWMDYCHCNAHAFPTPQPPPPLRPLCRPWEKGNPKSNILTCPACPISCPNAPRASGDRCS